MEPKHDRKDTKMAKSEHKQPRNIWTWECEEITASMFDDVAGYIRKIGKSGTTVDASDMIKKTKEYFENHEDMHDIWNNVKINIFDQLGNELLLKAGNGQYKIVANKLRGKTNILCTKVSGEIVIKPEEL
ncbi:uncharacterized protein LOC143043672 [Mytilus galloprovincialis]|uniref:uncharacterized protein LOC143043672 n=1 Tax=Mytilus galloprovincialis TaxID=29158 RepID=UPI003F7C4540